MSSKRLHAASRRRREVFREKFILMVIAAIAAVCGSIIVGNRLVDAHGNAQESPVNYKYYKSVEVHSGDTLWDIATQYTKADSHEVVIEYVKELKEINGLNSDTINEGQYLTVAYHSTEFVE